MGSNAGIDDGIFDRLEVIQDLGVGQDQDFGTDGQVLISGGENGNLRWGSNSATLPNKLNKSGNNIVLTRTSDGQEVSFFDGSVETDIASINTIYQADKGVEIDTTTSPETIQAKVDDTTPASQTISNSGGVANDELNVLRVPNLITFVNDGSGVTSGTFDGSSAISIEIDGGGAAFQADKGVEIDTTTNPHTIQAKVDVDSGNPKNQTITNDFNNDELHVLRVPENLTATLGLEYQSALTSYDGSVQTTIETKIDKTSGQTMSNSGGTGADELNVLKVPFDLVADTAKGTLTIGGSTSGVFNGGTADKTIAVLKVPFDLVADTANGTTTIGGSTSGVFNGTADKTIAVLKVPNKLTIVDGDTTTEFDGSVAKTLNIAQGSIDHTQVSRIGNVATQVFHSFPFQTVQPTFTTDAFQPINGWGIESLTAVSTDYLIKLSFQVSNPGSTTTSSGAFCRGVMRLDKSVATSGNPSTAWADANGVYSPIFFGGVKLAGGIFDFGVAGTVQTLLFNGRWNYTYVITNLTIGSTYNFIPKFYSFHNTNETKSEFSITYGGSAGHSTCSAVPIGINTPAVVSEEDY